MTASAKSEACELHRLFCCNPQRDVGCQEVIPLSPRARDKLLPEYVPHVDRMQPRVVIVVGRPRRHGKGWAHWHEPHFPNSPTLARSRKVLEVPLTGWNPMDQDVVPVP
jgi:hypothetical protein